MAEKKEGTGISRIAWYKGDIPDKDMRNFARWLEKYEGYIRINHIVHNDGPLIIFYSNLLSVEGVEIDDNLKRVFRSQKMIEGEIKGKEKGTGTSRIAYYRGTVPDDVIHELAKCLEKHEDHLKQDFIFYHRDMFIILYTNHLAADGKYIDDEIEGILKQKKKGRRST